MSEYKKTPQLVSAKAAPKAKDTIYIDVDDEITAIIDKVRSSQAGIVALVLPKRAPVFQSIVNMKLLKRTAEQTKQNIVLVTTEAGLLPLAGLARLHVASSATSKPVIPPMPDGGSDEPESVDEPEAEVSDADPEEFDPKAAGQKTVGELAGAAVAPAADSNQPEEVILPDEPDEIPAAGPAAKAKTPGAKKNKKLKVPSFNKFRLRFMLGVAVVLLLVAGWFVAARVLPKATVSIKTNSRAIDTALNLTLDTNAKEVNETNDIIPAVAQATQKTYSQQAPASGQKNNGSKAAGKITLVNCGADDITIAAGASFTVSGHTFIAASGTTVPVSNFSSPFTGSKCKNDGKSTVSVTALKGGADYNVAEGSATISGNYSGVTAYASQMTGGTDDIIKVVAQSDIDAAQAKIAAQDTNAVKQDLQATLRGKGLTPVPSSFVAGDQQVKSSAQAGDEADTVTVTATVPYTMLGINKSDLTTLVIASVQKQIGKENQKILDNGVDKATFSQQTKGSATSSVVAVKVQSVAGPELDAAQIKSQVAGKKTGEIKSLLGKQTGVTDVDVTYSPFWVSSVPADTSKITVDIANPSGAK